MPTEAELEEELNDLARRIERLRVSFQQYFMGIERIPPLFQREQLEKRFRETPLNNAKKTILKFRYLGLVQRYRTLSVYWDRMLRDIELGRFKRPTPREAAQEGETVARERVVESSSDGELRRLYERYLQACKEAGTPTTSLDYDKFRQAVEAQRRQATQRFGWGEVEFQVSTKGGKVVLKVKPKKGQ